MLTAQCMPILATCTPAACSQANFACHSEGLMHWQACISWVSVFLLAIGQLLLRPICYMRSCMAVHLLHADSSCRYDQAQLARAVGWFFCK